MKKLILCLPRTGSTSLFKQMVADEKAIGIFNPLDDSGRATIPWDRKETIIVKQNIIYPTRTLDRLEKARMYIEWASQFDEIRYITRHDLKAHAESFAYMNKHNDYFQFQNTQEGFTSDQKYIYKPVEQEQYDWAVYMIQEHDQILRRVAARLGGEIEYYEELFDPNSPERYRQIAEEGRLI